MDIPVPPPVHAYIPSEASSINMMDRVANPLPSPSPCPDPVLIHSLPPIIHPPHSAPTTNQHCMVTRVKSKSTHLLSMTASLSHPIEPTCISNAMPNPLWRDATSAQYNALIRNGTWKLIPPHPSQNVIGCKWLFCIKRKPDGSIDRYKARLVAKGFH